MSLLHLSSRGKSFDTDVRVMSLLLGSADDLGRVDISKRGVAERLGIGRSTVQRSLERLVSGGSLILEKRGTGDGYPSTYRIDAEWRAWRRDARARAKP